MTAGQSQTHSLTFFSTQMSIRSRVHGIADAMWTLVHARDDADPVKVRVTQHHEELARLGHRPM